MATKVIIQLVFVLTLFATKQAWGDRNGVFEKTVVLKHCGKYIKHSINYETPNPSCCSFVKHCDIVGICHAITQDDETNISVIKLAHVAHDCANPLPPRTKCGSKY